MPSRSNYSKTIARSVMEMTQQRCAIEEFIKIQPLTKKQSYGAVAIAGGLGFISERLLSSRTTNTKRPDEAREIARRRRSMALTAARFAYTLA